MAKYRTLTREELTALEKEFIDYLIVNGITADDWEKLKKETPAKANKIVDLFSDVVFEDVLRKTEFLELRTRTHIMTYQCLQDKIVLCGMHGGEAGDFTDPAFLQKALDSPPSDIELFTSEKRYNTAREEELFLMLSNGHLVSDGKLFKTLALVIADQA
ncbi:MAG: DUF6495 family protein [Imperialibacter sp.]|uniref:DUF6495 family protein n=1 Tax=Imperialibacter sp. TaxID=2038411 RepID=UPI0032ED9C31